MNAYIAFLGIPVAAVGAVVATWLAPLQPPPVALPVVQTLKVPVSPDAVPPVSRRDPAPVNLRPLVPWESIPVQTATGSEALVLSAIFVDGDRRVAHIGGDMYQVGENVGSYRLQRIEPMRVLLQAAGGSRVWLEMSKGF